MRILDITSIIELIEEWIRKLYAFLNTTYLRLYNLDFSLWDLTITAMILAALFAAVLPNHFDLDIPDGPAGPSEFYDDGYFDDDRYQL